MIGDEQWPLPIPLVKAGSGWEFDTDAGKDEMLSRRIGRNELRVIDLCRAYVLMQQEYASQPRDGKLAGLYAQQLRSDPGRQNGLYWEVGPGGAAAARSATSSPRPTTEGYDENKSAATPFYGYYFRVLTAQGAAAKGGAKDYLVNGEMSGGFGADRVSRRVRPQRHHDVHGEPGRRRLRIGPRGGDREGGLRD